MTSGRYSDNLLTSLHRWASGQDENFITDAFAHLLRRLLEYDPTIGAMILGKLTYGRMVVGIADASGTEVSTQVKMVLGRPDVKIRSGTMLAFIESKVESGLGNGQLERYCVELDADRKSLTKVLVLLSRYPVEIDDAIINRVVQRRWYQIADWLENVLPAVHDPINRFLIDQFVDFLRARNMTMDKVERDLPSGVHSLRSLLAMVGETLARAKLWTKRFGSWQSIGYFVENSRQFVGVYFDRPSVIAFEICLAPTAGGAGIPALDGQSAEQKLTGWKRTSELALDSEIECFFDESRDVQIQKITEFILQSIEDAKHIRSLGE